MTCIEATREIPNYCYGEITSEAEEALESHLEDCEICRAELAKHRKFLELLEEREPMVDAGLLVDCRNDFSRALRQEITAEQQHGAGWRGWRRFTQRVRDFSSINIPFRVPVGAMALVALGFVGARYTPEKFGGVRAALAAPMFSSVRSVEPAASGQIQIAVDETRRHVVSGSLQDPQIQELLLSGVTDGSNPNVRLQSIQVLHQATSENNADADQVRQALLGALEHDPVPGVRLKALEGLKQFSGDLTVRASLARVLQQDQSPAVRAQAIDLLAEHTDGSLVGVLQNVVQTEDNQYVRAQIAHMLAQFGASVGTY
ncbi:MAG TPA: HEAT repeat domain-containing protein [Bryobacteraceae bacterium]|nr:HEAT repeat domain-containing protein [Bryobacteraceae bacterium]